MEIKVTGQYLNITKKNLYASDSQEYLIVKFTFDSDWEGLTKTAVFYQNSENVYHVILDYEGSCTVPHEALAESGLLYIGVFGISGTKRITTNIDIVDIYQGSYGEGTTPPAPSEDIYAQMVAIMEAQSVDAQATLTSQGVVEGIQKDMEDLYEDYNTNATNKTTAFDNNATTKTTTFNDNATAKIEAFDSNAIEKTNAINLIKEDVDDLKDETLGYKDETKALKNSTQETIEEGFEELAGLAADFMGLTEEKTTDFNDNATTKTEAFNSNAIEKTEAINFIKDNVVDLKDETIGYKNEAKGSADNAKYSEEDAEQAFSDFLSTLGTDVATLTGGKLTPSQIPDLSINDVFTVADTDEMLLLNAQRGDVAIIVPVDVVTDSYILSADDPTILSNWKKLGVSYVANAGHATSADDATNSEKINGKRIVGMSESQYASAVLNEDTYYMVYPD